MVSCEWLSNRVYTKVPKPLSKSFFFCHFHNLGITICLSHPPSPTHPHTRTMSASPENPTAAHTDTLLGAMATREKFTHCPLSTHAKVKSQSGGSQSGGDLKLTSLQSSRWALTLSYSTRCLEWRAGWQALWGEMRGHNETFHCRFHCIAYQNQWHRQ